MCCRELELISLYQINDILDYSKIELDHLELSNDKVKIRGVIESSMDMLAERAASKSVEMALVLNQGDIAIVGDLTRLRQVVVNLLSKSVTPRTHHRRPLTDSEHPLAPSSSPWLGRSLFPLLENYYLLPPTKSPKLKSASQSRITGSASRQKTLGNYSGLF